MTGIEVLFPKVAGILPKCRRAAGNIPATSGNKTHYWSMMTVTICFVIPLIEMKTELEPIVKFRHLLTGEPVNRSIPHISLHHVTRFEPITAAHFDQTYNNDNKLSRHTHKYTQFSEFFKLHDVILLRDLWWISFRHKSTRSNSIQLILTNHALAEHKS